MHNLETDYILSRFKEANLLSDSTKSKVYMVLDTTTNRPYIQRVLPKDANMDIYRQIQSAALKNVPKIHHVVEDVSHNYVIEEYISGTRLDELIGNRGKVDVGQVTAWMSLLCETLQHLHNASPPIIHRDIKPSNIIITDDGTPKLIDFDISRNYKSGGSGDTKFLGTEYYASPEQFGFAQTDNRTDIYAAGKLMITMLTGKQQNPEEGLNDCGRLKIVIEKCCAIDPSQRYQNVSELRKALRLKLIETSLNG